MCSIKGNECARLSPAPFARNQPLVLSQHQLVESTFPAREISASPEEMRSQLDERINVAQPRRESGKGAKLRVKVKSESSSELMDALRAAAIFDRVIAI